MRVLLAWPVLQMADRDFAISLGKACGIRSPIGLWRPLIMVICGLVGCGRSVETKSEPPPPNLHQIQVLYTIYLQKNKLTGPANEGEFKRFIRAQGAAEARRQGIDLADLDQLFVSPRDGQPYIINYGLRFDPQTANRQAVVYETRGRDGLRAVAFATGWSEEVDAARAAELGFKID